MSPAVAIESTTLSNGLRVIGAPQRHLHRASASLFVAVGVRYETAESAGISHFLEHMLHRGTASLPDAHTQALAFERLGANVDAATGIDHGTLGLSAPPETFCEALGLLGEVAARPVFRDIDLERGIVAEEMREDLDETGRVVDPDALVRALLFRDHPLGLPIVGTRSTLRGFDVRALRAHHRRHYTTSSAVLSLAGRLPSHDKLFKLVSEAFGAMAKGRPVRFRPLSGPATGPHLVVRHTSSSQASVRVGFVGPGRRDPDEPAIELLLRVVDDGTSTRLYERLCDRGGLCYEVSAGFEAYDEVSLFDFAAETRPGASARVLSALLSICKELAEHGPTEDEMSKAKRRAKWFAERALDQPEAFAEHVGHSALHGKPLTPTDRYARMAAVTRDDVRDAAARLFTPERLGVAIVGPVSSAMDARVERLVERFC